ncbi:MAG: hypothetical protein KIS61_34615 [Candidatus Eremiobacteraeota bacterium]|nr:hypothetical protein [Candidatus Eremiobacteraeota bacterium]
MAQRLADRFIDLFRNNREGWRPTQGGNPEIRNLPFLFHEYFHAEEGLGLAPAINRLDRRGGLA